ncbi:MAG: Ig-like domain-containing protein [Chloroflexi bacterium]|nr:Ig-like domain-containing protein [Chloroflexota bacterium]
MGTAVASHTASAALALIAATLIAACGGGPQATGGSPSPSAGPSAAGTDACARAAASRGWTTERSYSRGIVPRGDGIQLGLGGRQRATVRASVKAPDGSALVSTKTQEQSRGDAMVRYVVRYPADFTPAGATSVLGVTTPGTYGVTWEADGSLAACDTFEVAPTGVADAQSCAPAGWSATAPGSTLVMRSGTASMSITGDQQILGVASDPWYVFEPTDRETLALPDGTSATLYVSQASTPKRVAAQFRAGQVPYRFDASAEAIADLVQRSRDVIACAQQRLQASSTATPSTATSPAATIDPRPVVMPSAVTLRVGETQRFAAAQQERGSFGPPIRVTWSVSPPSLGTITPDGVFTAASVGTGTVTATLPGSLPFSGSATVTVR